ncbi:hypothetical protein [Cohnella sp. REN36]
MVPEGLRRMNKRQNYQQADDHASLKDRRDKRDEMKAKLAKAKDNK